MTKLMPTITAIVLALFSAYCAAWYFGSVEGNFSLLLFLATIVTGVYWLLEKCVFQPGREQSARMLDEQALQRQAELTRQGISQTEVHAQEMRAARDGVLAQPWWLDWTAGLFPVIVVVFFLRSFLFEPFKIPTGSMIPTLMVGDLILVNKYTYGIRLPVVNKKIVDVSNPQRGDVMVFRYPPKPSMDYIKRVIGLPGDEVSYLNKQLRINGQPISKLIEKDFLDPDSMRYSQQFTEQLPRLEAAGSPSARSSATATFKILNDAQRPAFIPGVSEFPGEENCRYSAEGVVCKVPAGHYFMMGDNRDNSLDSRYWGFVPEQNIVGKAFFVWMNFGNLGRIGSFE